VLEPYTANFNQDFARTYFTSDQIGEESVDVHQFWEIDGSGIRSLPVMTVKDKTNPEVNRIC